MRTWTIAASISFLRFSTPPPRGRVVSDSDSDPELELPSAPTLPPTQILLFSARHVYTPQNGEEQAQEPSKMKKLETGPHERIMDEVSKTDPLPLVYYLIRGTYKELKSIWQEMVR